MVRLAAEGGSIELLAVEQRDHRVLEFHARHFARQRHVADRELVFALDREVVLDGEAAARTERHPFEAMLLPAGAGSAGRRQRDHHVGDVAVGDRLGGSFGVADRLERDGARGVDVLIHEIGRHLEGGGVGVEVALDVVVRQPGLAVDVEADQIADGVPVLPPVEAAQWHAPGGAGPASRRSRSRATTRTPSDWLSGRLAPAGGIMPLRSFRITFSATSALWRGVQVQPDNARPPALTRSLWQVRQYWLISAPRRVCLRSDGARGPTGATVWSEDATVRSQVRRSQLRWSRRCDGPGCDGPRVRLWCLRF